MTIWQPFGKEMLKHKYLHSILQQNKFNAINIFGLDIVWCFVIEGNVHQKYGSSSSNRYLLSASWQLSQEQNKTNDPEIHWKIRTVTLSQNYLVLTKRSVFYFESSFRSWDNQILTFQTFKCHDVIKCTSMKHETHITVRTWEVNTV